MSAKRIAELRKKMKAENLDAMIVTHLDHIRYLAGFTGTAGMLIVKSKGADFFTDFRYKDQAGKQVTGAKVHIVQGEAIGQLKEFPDLNKKNFRYGFDGEYLTVTQRNRIRHALPEVLLANASGVLGELGWVKDKAEIRLIEKAVEISDVAFERILNILAPGVRESEVRAELEYQMMMLGSEKPAFETIVASGWRSALPHGVASTKKIDKGDFVTFDFGATYKGYVSDMTRTVVIGKATSKQKRIYNLVLRAQKAGVRKVKAGVDGKAVDGVCRRIITKAGHGDDFGHGTGHGIGYFVHVGPRVSPKSNDKLKAGNVITIEPGVYLSGWGGVRIEDDVVVTRSGGRVLNKAPKNLLEL
ncbi:M24 family metallopeptidase [candidate division GN15 bacterium]|nr:M24 family metallopeptidase [candidate division GN15 bacterium]